MTDHANEIRDVLMWAQAYAPDRLAHRLIDAEESLRELLAGHAAEVEKLRQDVAQYRASLRQFESSSALALREARAEAETLRQENERLSGLIPEIREVVSHYDRTSSRDPGNNRRMGGRRKRLLDAVTGRKCECGATGRYACQYDATPWEFNGRPDGCIGLHALAAAQEPPAEGAAT